MGLIAPLSTIGLVKAKAVSHKRKSGVEPDRQSFLAAPAVDLVPNVLVLQFLWIIPVRPRGGFLCLGSLVSPSIFPRLAPWKRNKPPQLCFGVIPTAIQEDITQPTLQALFQSETLKDVNRQ